MNHEDLLTNWPLPDTEISSFPHLKSDGTLATASHLSAFLKLEGVDVREYDIQRGRSGLDVQDSKLDTYRNMYEKLGIVFRKAGKLRLTAFGLWMKEIVEETATPEIDDLAELTGTAIETLARYQLRNPSDTEIETTLPDTCDIFPYLCIWTAMMSLDGKLHYEELNRVVMRVMVSSELTGAIERIKIAREELGSYLGCDQLILDDKLGIPAVSDQPKSRIAALFSLAGWGGLLIDDHDDQDGYRHFVAGIIPQIEPLMATPPRFYEAVDLDDWFNHYSSWSGGKSHVSDRVTMRTEQTLSAYRAQDILVQEHASIERANAQGGYGHRQLYELIQNAADALHGFSGGNIRVVLTNNALYCANEGEPISTQGVDSILTSHISYKGAGEIGRFGLGFKSVLGVTSQPAIHSRSGSIEFDRDKSAEIIKEIVRDAQAFPVLRLAFPTSTSEAAEKDEVLAQMVQWADTVIKLPFDSQAGQWLSDDLAAFPEQFLLFCPVVQGLNLEDLTRGKRRNIKLSGNGNTVSIESGQGASTWKVFSVVHQLSEVAKEDAPDIAERESVQLSWAVPIKGQSHFESKSPGQFWAFFPTTNSVKLSGILNAPWKTNQDRQNLLEGPFNLELINAYSAVIASALPDLADAEDPTGFLEYLPGRRDEFIDWADDSLNSSVFSAVAQVPSLPDMEGILRNPIHLRMHPTGLSPLALELWRNYSGGPKNWIHHSVETQTRRFRAERLIRSTRGEVSNEVDWLESLVEDRSPAASIAAIVTATEVIRRSNPRTAELVRTARIVLNEDGQWAPLNPGLIFTNTSGSSTTQDLIVVDATVSSSKDALEALRFLGVAEVDTSSSMETFLASRNRSNWEYSDWKEFWDQVDIVPANRVIEILKRYFGDELRSKVQVMTIAGKFRRLDEVLLPGSILWEKVDQDSSVGVDMVFHHKHLATLGELGVADGPQARGGSTSEHWFRDYLKESREEYYKNIPPGGPRPQQDYIDFGTNKMWGPLSPIISLSDEGKVRFSEFLLNSITDVQPWELSHSTLFDRYPTILFPAPELWIIRKHGLLNTSLGGVLLSRAVGRGLRDWSKVFPVYEGREDIGQVLKLPDTLDQLNDAHWNTALISAESSGDIELLSRFYSVACEYLSAPEKIKCVVGAEIAEHPPETVTVTDDKTYFDALSHGSVPSLLVANREDADQLSRKWRLQQADDRVSAEVRTVGAGPETPITDRFLGLSAKLRPEHETLFLVPCESVTIENRFDFAIRQETRSIVRDGNLVYYIQSFSNEDLLDELTSELEISLTSAERLAILDNRAFADRRARAREIRIQETLAGKLLSAVGPEAIIKKLPTGLLEVAVARDPDFESNDLRFAELALAVWGVDVLRTFRAELRNAKLEPPAQWAGGFGARTFVSTLGFPEEYAGFREQQREPDLQVEGAPELPPLHTFQQLIVNNIKELFRSKSRRRGLLSLPTGAGKTRVAVQSTIEGITEGLVSGPVLWVAQTDELCEQAVQSWSEVWRSMGGSRRPLHINRLWSSNEASPQTGIDQVVVATIDKLKGCINDTAYDWLSNPGCVIIDEAHGATTPEYTNLLRWLNLDRGRDSRPLLGLTATPFRGGEAETASLVTRFAGNRLDAGIFPTDPYTELQRMGVLARVQHCFLLGVTVEDLSQEELAELARFSRVPASAAARIGINVARNQVLLDSLVNQDPTWPILVFAASVDHARTLAALLNAEGISAAAISSDTEPGARRHYVEKYRRGEIRVLTNYGILTAGFDAPSTRAIYVARPVFSPGLYQQMVGRGLRGPLNGGKEVCLIMNVKDNFVQYGEDLAFTKFEHLWDV